VLSALGSTSTVLNHGAHDWSFKTGNDQRVTHNIYRQDPDFLLWMLASKPREVIDALIATGAMRTSTALPVGAPIAHVPAIQANEKNLFNAPYSEVMALTRQGITQGNGPDGTLPPSRYYRVQRTATTNGARPQTGTAQGKTVLSTPNTPAPVPQKMTVPGRDAFIGAGSHFDQMR
jgi:hypothetical protein